MKICSRQGKFELVSVNYSTWSERHNRDIISIFFNMKVCCVFSLESPYRGYSYENKQHTIFNIKKKITHNHPKSAAMGFFPKGLKNEFETAVVNEQSVFESEGLLYILETKNTRPFRSRPFYSFHNQQC